MAAAAMAASMFAVDFSAGVRLEGSLFNLNADGSVSALTEKHVNEMYHAPISFAVSGDKAGGQLKLSDKGGDDVVSDAWSIWFKPMDALKVTVGRWSTNLNQEHIGWCNTDSGIETDGYALSFGSGAFSADVFFASGNGNAWFSKAKDADAKMAEIYAKAQFGADFGTVNGFVNAINSFKDLRFGAGLNLAGLPVGLWFNVIGTYAAEEFQRIRVEADVSGAVDSIGYEVFVAGGYNMGTNAGAMNAFTGVEGWHVAGSYGIKEASAFAGMYAKVTFPMGPFGGYVEIKDSDFLAENFAMNVKPGFTTNVGACAINCAISADIAEKVAISVPVEFKVSF